MILSQDMRHQQQDVMLQMQRAAARNSMMTSVVLPPSPASRTVRPTNGNDKFRERMVMRSKSSSLIATTSDKSSAVNMKSIEDALMDSQRELALKKTLPTRSQSASLLNMVAPPVGRSCPPPQSRKRLNCKANMTPAAPPTRPSMASKNLMTSLPTPVLLPHHPNKKPKTTASQNGNVVSRKRSIIKQESVMTSPSVEQSSRTNNMSEVETCSVVSDEPKNKKSVDFNNRVKVRRIPLLKDTPRSIIQDVYFSREELTVMRADVRRKLVQHVDQQQGWGDAMDAVAQYLAQGDLDYDNEGNFYLRGLEAELPNAKHDRKLLRLQARKQVMKSQFLQHSLMSEGEDEETLADAYASKSKTSVDLAILAAIQDAKVAKEILQQQ